MSMQQRGLIQVTVSDYLKLLLDTFEELIVTIVIFGARAWCSSQVSVAVADEFVATLIA